MALNQDCAVLPLATRWPNLDRIRAPEPGVVFGFFGGLRTEKGASLIARAVPEFAALHPDTKFLVHAPKAESDPSVVEALESVPQAQLICHNFSRKIDYLNEFARANCILCPYDPVAYAFRPSVVLLEALALGRLIITTRNSWCYTEVERHGGKLIPMSNFTSDALLSSLTEAHGLLRTQPIKPKINRQVVAENSPAAFCRALMQLVNAT
jgi:glycosyltransferase involved in cell wall biosynthesis